MLKNILIHLDGSKQSNSRLQTAIGLANRHGAHLTGLYVVTHPEIPTFIEAQIGGEIIDSQIKAAAQQGKDVLADFEKAVTAAGLEFECRLIEGTLTDCLVEQGRCFDLLVVGQYDPEGAAQLMPDSLILSVGRPVLIIPYAGSFPVVGDNVIVSWDGSRPATRAVNDAMDILQAAQKVDVLSINPADKGLVEVSSANLVLHLARHGLKATAKQITTDEIEAADMLLSRVSDCSADLVVMGAYGHARWREYALGGFTRHMLAHMTVPVLMSN
jgi:nucleotide-binding universal stress UspA family protein